MQSQINVAIVGVGNNCSALLQGWARSSSQAAEVGSPELVAGFRLNDLAWVAAFDISANKVGLDLSSAIHAEPNNFPIYELVPSLGVDVLCAPRLDGLSNTAAERIPTVADDEMADVARFAALLRDREVHVVLNLVPAGSLEVARFWAQVALATPCAFLNATPDPIAQDPKFVDMFKAAGLPLLGDDLESQMGATVIHRSVLETLRLKGLSVSGTYQMNVGGNMDFFNLTTRGESKAVSKTRGLMLPAGSENIDVIPAAGHFPFLGDRKVAHIHIEASGWLGTVNNLDIRLEIHDSCSAASALGDLLRIARYELDKGTSGLVYDAGFYFKSAVSKKDLASAFTARSHYLNDRTAE